MVEKIGIRNEVAILDSRGWVWAGLSPQPGPDPAARIQDGDLITNSVFFDHPTACEQANRDFEGASTERKPLSSSPCQNSQPQKTKNLETKVKKTWRFGKKPEDLSTASKRIETSSSK